jgi:hypothetical protein
MDELPAFPCGREVAVVEVAVDAAALLAGCVTVPDVDLAVCV